MKYKELKEVGIAELKEKKKELYKELMKDNAQVATGTTPKSPGKIRNLKKDIARINSIVSDANKKTDDKKQEVKNQ